MNACRCTYSILTREVKTPKKTAIKLCYKQKQLFKQIESPEWYHQHCCRSHLAGAGTTTAHRVLSTWPSPQRTAGTSTLSRKLDIFWQHRCYFTCVAIALHLCSNTRAFQKVLEWLLYLFHPGMLGVRRRAAGGGSASHSTDAAGPAPLSKDRLARHPDILDHQSCSSKSTQMRELRRKMYLRGRPRIEDWTK